MTGPSTSDRTDAAAVGHESIDDYLARLVAAAPPITAAHPAAALLIQHFKNHTAEQAAEHRRKTA